MDKSIQKANSHLAESLRIPTQGSISSYCFSILVPRIPTGYCKWEKHYQELVEYKQEHGDTRVPRK